MSEILTPDEFSSAAHDAGRPYYMVKAREKLLVHDAALRARVAALEAANEVAHTTERAALEHARMAEAQLAHVIPECFVCPTCGPLVEADEDGLCAHCGSETTEAPTASVVPTATALQRAEAAEGRVAVLTEHLYGVAAEFALRADWTVDSRHWARDEDLAREIREAIEEAPTAAAALRAKARLADELAEAALRAYGNLCEMVTVEHADHGEGTNCLQCDAQIVLHKALAAYRAASGGQG